LRADPRSRPPEFLDLREAFLRRAAQPILQVLPNLGMAVHIVFLDDFANHFFIIVPVFLFCNG